MLAMYGSIGLREVLIALAIVSGIIVAWRVIASHK
jgi:hypothetical protein